eukprot:scaffold7386_cov509-Prasinococcus_capsulatus_cf.AAC.5
MTRACGARAHVLGVLFATAKDGLRRSFAALLPWLERAPGLTARDQHLVASRKGEGGVSAGIVQRPRATVAALSLSACVAAADEKSPPQSAGARSAGPAASGARACGARALK